MRIVETMQTSDWPAIIGRVEGVALLLAGVLLVAGLCSATPQDNSVPSIFDPHSTPASSIRNLSHFVLGVTGLICLVVFGLQSYVIVKFGSRAADTEREPAQVYGSAQIKLAWTIIPILIVVVLFLAARVESGGQRGPALDSVAVRLTQDQLIRQVIQGGGNMLAYGKNLSPAETTALVTFLETLHPAGQTPAHNAALDRGGSKN